MIRKHINNKTEQHTNNKTAKEKLSFLFFFPQLRLLEDRVYRFLQHLVHSRCPMRFQLPLESRRADSCALHAAPTTAPRLHGLQPLVHRIQQVTHVVTTDPKISRKGLALRIGFRGPSMSLDLSCCEAAGCLVVSSGRTFGDK